MTHPLHTRKQIPLTGLKHAGTKSIVVVAGVKYVSIPNRRNTLFTYHSLRGEELHRNVDNTVGQVLSDLLYNCLLWLRLRTLSATQHESVQ